MMLPPLGSVNRQLVGITEFGVKSTCVYAPVVTDARLVQFVEAELPVKTLSADSVTAPAPPPMDPAMDDAICAAVHPALALFVVGHVGTLNGLANGVPAGAVFVTVVAPPVLVTLIPVPPTIVCTGAVLPLILTIAPPQVSVLQ